MNAAPAVSKAAAVEQTAQRVSFEEAGKVIRKNANRPMDINSVALYTTVDGKRQLNAELVHSWQAVGEGGTCPRCGTGVELDWGCLVCSRCEQEWMDVRGCQCGGDIVCIDCLWTRTTTGDERAVCTRDCDGLCSVHCPDS